ncbi:hypothetical protein CKN52_07950 [Acinetobacter baumannii]|nr:hypothetical protein CKN52_07950 [Acinetobacter baumannii]
MSLKSGIVNSLKNGVLPPDYRELIRVVERKRVDRLEPIETSTHGASPFRPTAKKGDARA